ncbi:MAG: hypothetical protein ABR928_11430 [Terracidiphilus sp.]
MQPANLLRHHRHRHRNYNEDKKDLTAKIENNIYRAERQQQQDHNRVIAPAIQKAAHKEDKQNASGRIAKFPRGSSSLLLIPAHVKQRGEDFPYGKSEGVEDKAPYTFAQQGDEDEKIHNEENDIRIATDPVDRHSVAIHVGHNLPSQPDTQQYQQRAHGRLEHVPAPGDDEDGQNERQNDFRDRDFADQVNKERASEAD